jgi:hypothetical protein
MFVNSNGPLPGMDLSVPDVYLQPSPAGPIPVPFMSMGMRITDIPICMRFLLCCMPSNNLMDEAPATISGPGPGAASGMVCSESKNAKGSAKFFIQGAPATRALLDPTLQNGMSPNSVGNTIVPSQIRLMNPSA